VRIVLLGPGNIEKHAEFIGTDKETILSHIPKIAKKLKGYELILLPDGGICFEIAKEFKKMYGPVGKIIGTVPVSDKDFGIEHLKPYMNATVEHKGKKIRVFDEFIDTKDWYRQDMQIGLFGHEILFLGITLGTMGELAYAYYLYKLFKGKKKGVAVALKSLHPDIKADEVDVFTTYIYEPFLPNGLPEEIVKYIKDSGGNVKNF